MTSMKKKIMVMTGISKAVERVAYTDGENTFVKIYGEFRKVEEYGQTTKYDENERRLVYVPAYIIR